MSESHGHGGPRPGSGRKRIKDDEPLVRSTVTLLKTHHDYLAKLGDGNVSAGIRKLVEGLIDKPSTGG
jgi:hypothetical protein